MSETGYQSRFEKMEERLNEMEVTLDVIDKKLSQVVDALVGNSLVKSDGLVSRIERFEREMQDLKDFKKRIIYSVSAIVALGLLIQFFLKLYVDLNK